MKFNHLIQINDPLLPLVDALTRNQLWQGLVLRAQEPALFVPYLDGCTISAVSGTGFTRTLRYGDLEILDLVTLTPEHTVLYAIPEQKDIAPSSLTMTIEEPQPDLFFVRFAYEDTHAEAAGSVDAFYNEFRLSAYEEADIDTIRLIRQMAQEGKLG
ncbi:SRPBCC family protein [Actimicrobium antarcticum]|uniref:SRPBCC family protein n=1 Tax=Actimicrobium antarcticum TaxID=1051899 RepID=A0ABP7T2S7_9BURK